VTTCQFRDKPFALGCELNADPPTIAGIAPSCNQPLLAGTIEQLDQAMVLKLHTLGEGADGRLLAGGQPFQRDQELVMLRLQAERPRFTFAEMQKAAELVAKFSQRKELLIGQSARGHRKYIIS